MTNVSIYKDIAARTGGDIYIGVVGPVRTGKSTFIKQFMDKLVLPNISGEYQKERANDELPQSSSGRTIMTTEPKFIPEKGVQISLDDSSAMNVRLRLRRLHSSERPRLYRGRPAPYGYDAVV